MALERGEKPREEEFLVEIDAGKWGKVRTIDGGSIVIPANFIWTVSNEAQGRFFTPYGKWRYFKTEINNQYRLVRQVQRLGDHIVEFGPSEGRITAKHLSCLPMFEAIVQKIAEDALKSGVKPVLAKPWAEPAPPPIARVQGTTWGLIFSCLTPPNRMGVFTFGFDAGLVGLQGTSSQLRRTVSNHPVWVTGILGLSYRHVGAILGFGDGVSCAKVARHVCVNAARLPELIRKDPWFRNILAPETRHKIAERQKLIEASGPELPPKVQCVQLLGTFLLGEPQYRGDADKDPVAGELLALCQKIAKEDPAFVLKLAYYTRNTLTFRNTTNFLLAAAVKIDECRPLVRTALPKCTNLPTDLLELWDFWRKLSGSITLPACLKKGMGDKFGEFSEYQLGKYINARVPKPQQVSVMPARKSKGKGKGKGGGEPPADGDDEEKPVSNHDPLTRPLTLKTLVRATHVGGKRNDVICGVLRKMYPMDEEEFMDMGLDMDGTVAFDPEKSGAMLRIPIPRTWETELSAKGNTAEVWEGLVKSKSLPFMAMLRNLRNLIMAGVDDETHNIIIGRLTSKHQVTTSRQMPVRFLSAFEAIDFDDELLAKLLEESRSESEWIEEEKAVGEGKEAKKIMKKRRVCRRPPTRELLDRYRNGLETAITLAATNNMPEIECPTGGKAVVLVDCSGSMDSPLTQGPKKLHDAALTPHRRTCGRPIVEGQDMCLEDYFSQGGQRLSKKVSVSMTWIGQDLDLSVMIMDKDGKEVASVSYSSTSWESIQHSGDITNAPHGAEEVITCDLGNLPPSAYMLTFTVNSFSGQTFDELPEAAISLRDDGLDGSSVEGTQEICAFRITGKQRAVIVCALVKKERGWAFRCLNTTQGHGMTVGSLLGKIRKEYEAMIADAATNGKRLTDAALLLALCLRAQMGDEKCEVVLFGSPSPSNPSGYYVLKGLGPKVLANVRRCHQVIRTLGSGTEIPISHLQELTASDVKLDHLVLLTDGLVAPAKNPADGLSRWLRCYRATVNPVKFSCIDILGLGKPCVSEGGNAGDVLISGYSEAALRYIALKPDAQLAEIEAVELPPPKEPTAAPAAPAVPAAPAAPEKTAAPKKAVAAKKTTAPKASAAPKEPTA